jgi:hypothetical protein
VEAQVGRFHSRLVAGSTDAQLYWPSPPVLSAFNRGIATPPPTAGNRGVTVLESRLDMGSIYQFRKRGRLVGDSALWTE